MEGQFGAGILVAGHRLQIGKELWKDGVASYFECTEEGRLFTVKVVPKEHLRKQRLRERLTEEVEIHRSLQHPGIVKFEGYCEDEQHVNIVVEHCPNQTMRELLRKRRRFPEPELPAYLLPIVSALMHLRSQSILHRNLKLSSLFLTDTQEVKLGDFSLATTIVNQQRRRSICGNANYLPPEMLDGEGGYSFEIDVWALGVVTYTLLVGKSPFEATDVRRTYQLIRENAVTFPASVHISSETKALILRMLESSPSRRATIDEIAAHQFCAQRSTVPVSLSETQPSASDGQRSCPQVSEKTDNPDI